MQKTDVIVYILLTAFLNEHPVSDQWRCRGDSVVGVTYLWLSLSIKVFCCGD